MNHINYFITYMHLIRHLITYKISKYTLYNL